MSMPAKLTALADQRLALIEHALGSGAIAQPELNLIMTPLTEPDPDASELVFRRWDRTCDNCGRYCPPYEEFYSGQIMRMLKSGIQVLLTYGVCKDCKW